MLRRSTTSLFLTSSLSFLANNNKRTKQTAVASTGTTKTSSTTTPQLGRRVAPHIKYENPGAEDDEDDIPKIRVGVLQPHNEGTWSEDDVRCSPAIFSSNRLKKEVGYDQFTIRKNSAFKQLRALTSEDKCDVFWNLCDGARDEVRTGEDTVRILESLNVPFTGADSQGFEPSKIEMKMLLAAAGIKTPNFAVLDRSDVETPSSTSAEPSAAATSSSKKSKNNKDDNALMMNDASAASIAKSCSHLRFPVIVKHISGYGSVGIKADSKCDNMQQLVKKVKSFVKEFDVALVEEFIIGEEGTVFVCGDQNSPTGCHVFPPLMIPVPGGASEFLHFDKKWKELKDLEADEDEDSPSAAETTSKKNGKKNKNKKDEKKEEKPTLVANADFLDPDGYHYLERGQPITEKIEKMAANAFIHIMQRVGYGRCDFRIDQVTKEPYFLEINPNCGIFLPYEKTGTYEEGYGDFADLMIERDWGHDKFIRSQIDIAIKQQRARVPWWNHTYSASAGNFVTKCAKSVPRLTRVFGDDVRPIPVVARTLFDATIKHKISADDVHKVGCAIFRADTNIQNCVMLQHSCKPNCALVHSNTLELATTRAVQRGEMLTIDYATLRDAEMPDFRCDCGADNCRGIVKAQSPKLRGERALTSGSSSASSSSTAAKLAKEPIQRKSSSAVKSSQQEDVFVEAPTVAAASAASTSASTAKPSPTPRASSTPRSSLSKKARTESKLARVTSKLEKVRSKLASSTLLNPANEETRLRRNKLLSARWHLSKRVEKLQKKLRQLQEQE